MITTHESSQVKYFFIVGVIGNTVKYGEKKTIIILEAIVLDVKLHSYRKT